METDPIIYHVTQKAAWEHAANAGSYTAALLSTEGFIHCCANAQLSGVLQRYFYNQVNLIKLTINPA